MLLLSRARLVSQIPGVTRRMPEIPDLEGYREELLRMVDTGRALSGESGRIAAK